MIGCTARSRSATDIKVDRRRIGEDARWFDRAELALQMLGDTHPRRPVRRPNRIAIAHHLLGQWLRGGSSNGA